MTEDGDCQKYKAIGKDNSSLAMNITGFFVSIPVFCDSGYVILSTLNKAINRKTGISLAVLGTSLAAGLYATHVFVPPTPGPLASASILGADIGLVLIFGFLIAIPVSLVGWLWSIYFCSKFSINTEANLIKIEKYKKQSSNLFSALLPIIIPIILISLKSLMDHPTTNFENVQIERLITFFGHPIICLLYTSDAADE